MRDGRLEASGHNWVEGQGSGPRIDKADGEDDTTYDAMGNKVDNKKTKKLTSAEARKVRISLCRHFAQYLLVLSFHSSRRNVWQGRREARRSLMMSSKIIAVFHLFLLFSSPHICHTTMFHQFPSCDCIPLPPSSCCCLYSSYNLILHTIPFTNLYHVHDPLTGHGRLRL